MPLLSGEVALDAPLAPLAPLGPEAEQDGEEEFVFVGPLTLMAAVRANDAELIDQALRTGRIRCVNAPDIKTGWTALMWALYLRSSMCVCRKLLEAGADPNRTDPSGLSAVHWSAYHGPADACSLVLEFGGDLTKRNAKGATPLMLAAKAGREDVIKVLIAYGAIATVDLCDTARKTALSFAVNGGHVNAVEALLAAGADFIVPELPKDPSGGLCKRLIEAAERAYVLHKLRALHRQEMERKAKNEGLVPRLLQCGEKKSSRNCLLRLMTAKEEDTPAAVLNFVVTDLCSELFIETLALM